MIIMDKEENALDELRDEINQLDLQLLKVISRRMEVVEKVGKYKQKHKLPSLQEHRWQEIFKTRLQWAKDLKLSEEFVSEIFKLIHEESVAKQDQIKKKLIPQEAEDEC